jgi:phage shock protein PspC (stress-responsive transcriptional regulator)
MEKAISIAIGGLVFAVESDAYEKLEKYLGSLKSHFISFADSGEIISDIESRIAEKFSEKIKDGKRQVINLSDVEEIISAMGEASALGGEDSEKKSETKEEKKAEAEEGAKRLFRSPDDMIIAGVASGLAAYFGIDAVIVRLIFVLLTVFGGGSGILIYIILWVITPEAKTTSDKLEMRGKPVTVAKIEKTIKETLEKNNINKTSVHRFFDGVAEILRRIFSLSGILLGKLLVILGIIIGISFIIAAVASIFGIGLGASMAIFNFNSPYFDLSFLQGIAGSRLFNIFIMAASFTAIIPLVFLFMLGILLVSQKKPCSCHVSLLPSLLTVWMIAIIIAGVIGLRLAPQIEGAIEKNQTIPANAISLDYQLQDFNGVVVDDTDQAIIIPGEKFSVIAEGADKDLAKAKIRVSNGKLSIDRKFSFLNFGFSRTIKITITMPELKSINLDGMATAQVGSFRQADMSIKMDGLSKAEVETELTGQLKVNLDGMSKLSIKGMAQDVELNLDGMAKYNAQDLLTSTGKYNLDGRSYGEIYASDSIKVKTDGASHLIYSGNAKAETSSDGISKIEFRQN